MFHTLKVVYQSYVNEIRDETARTREEVLADWDASVEGGSYWRADTLEELVELAGLPARAVEEAVPFVSRPRPPRAFALAG